MSSYHLEVIVYRNSSPAEGYRVSACGTGTFGGFTEETRTDSNGRATIMTTNQDTYTLYVDGNNKGIYRSPGQAIVYI